MVRSRSGRDRAPTVAAQRYDLFAVCHIPGACELRRDRVRAGECGVPAHRRGRDPVGGTAAQPKTRELEPAADHVAQCPSQREAESGARVGGANSCRRPSATVRHAMLQLVCRIALAGGVFDLDRKRRFRGVVRDEANADLTVAGERERVAQHVCPRLSEACAVDEGGRRRGRRYTGGGTVRNRGAGEPWRVAAGWDGMHCTLQIGSSVVCELQTANCKLQIAERHGR